MNDSDRAQAAQAPLGGFWGDLDPIARARSVAGMPPKQSEKAKGKRPAHVVDAAETAKILVPIKRLRTQMGSSAAVKKTLAEIGIKGVHKEVRGMARHEVRANIEHICLQAVATIMKGEGFSYTMPARTSVETKPGVAWVPARPTQAAD